MWEYVCLNCAQVYSCALSTAGAEQLFLCWWTCFPLKEGWLDTLSGEGSQECSNFQVVPQRFLWVLPKLCWGCAGCPTVQLIILLFPGPPEGSVYLMNIDAVWLPQSHQKSVIGCSLACSSEWMWSNWNVSRDVSVDHQLKVSNNHYAF